MNESSTGSEKILKFTPAIEPRRFYDFGPFRLDAVERQLYREGEIVPLTPKTIELLILLAERHGQIVDKETLLAALWPDTFVEESNLTQHISRLRKAFGNGSEPDDYIETIPKRGYRFIAPLMDSSLRPMPAPTSRRVSRGWFLVLAVLLVAIVAVTALRSKSQSVSASQISEQAREAYLKGRHHWNRRTVADFHTAVEYFRAAVESEPRYGMAWAGLADTYNLLGQPERARVAAERALEIDPNLAEAHAALGNFSMFYEYDLAKAEKAFLRAIELRPSYASAHHWYAFNLAARGRFDEAVQRIQQARRMEPLSIIINVDAGVVHYHARRYDEAIRELRKALELDPSFAQAHRELAWSYLRIRLLDEANREFREAERLLNDRHDLVELHLALGAREQASTEFVEMEREALADPGTVTARTNPYGLARNAAALGDRDRAMYWLERSYTRRDGDLIMVAVDPGFDPLRADPRFQDLLARMKLRQ